MFVWFLFHFIALVIDLCVGGFFFFFSLPCLFCKPLRNVPLLLLLLILCAACQQNEVSLKHSSHLSRCVSQPEEHGVWWAFLSSLSHVAQEQGASCSVDLAACSPCNISQKKTYKNRNKLVVLVRRWMVWAALLLELISRENYKTFCTSFSGWIGSLVEESSSYLVVFKNWPKCCPLRKGRLWHSAIYTYSDDSPVSGRESLSPVFLLCFPHLIQVLGKESHFAYHITSTGWRHLEALCVSSRVLALTSWPFTIQLNLSVQFGNIQYSCIWQKTYELFLCVKYSLLLMCCLKS